MADTTIAFPKYGSGGGQVIPVKAVDNGDGTYSLDIGANLTLDPTDLNLEASQQLVLTAAQAILAKIIAAPATAAKQDTAQASLTALVAAYANSFTNITTSTTTTAKSGAGALHCVTVNALGTVASTVTIYDNTAGSGTKIGTIDSLTLKGAFFFDVAFATGLTLVTTGTLAPDITVSYR